MYNGPLLKECYDDGMKCIELTEYPSTLAESILPEGGSLLFSHSSLAPPASVAYFSRGYRYAPVLLYQL